MKLTVIYKIGTQITLDVKKVIVNNGFIHYDLDEKLVFFGHLPFGKIPLDNVESFEVTKGDIE